MKVNDLTLKQLSDDVKEFDQEYWVAAKDVDGRTRHITLHLTKLLGKIGEVAERREHGMNPRVDKLKDEVIPDLLIYAIQLSQLYDVDLQAAYFARQANNRKRVKGWQNNIITNVKER